MVASAVSVACVLSTGTLNLSDLLHHIIRLFFQLYYVESRVLMSFEYPNPAKPSSGRVKFVCQVQSAAIYWQRVRTLGQDA